jgi:N-acetylmuramoyl-L-alanine amidase
MFKMKYEIKKQYLTPKTKRRPAILMPYVGFLVSHDTGNDGSTAKGNVSWYEQTRNDSEASAQTFIDDVDIIECIPATIDKPEKAWHVLYNRPEDNAWFGDDANDIAIGIELCYTNNKGKINNNESYKRYVWYHAYCCYKFNLDPYTKITGHNELDPDRKSDPFKNALKIMGISKAQFIQDVANEYADCTRPEAPVYLYAVYQGEIHLLDYTNYDDAVACSQMYADSSVRKISDGSWVWASPKEEVKPEVIVEPVKEVRKLDAETVEKAKKAIDELAQAGLLESPEYWKARIEENLPVWAYMIVESRKIKKQ